MMCLHLERHDFGRARAEWRLDRGGPKGLSFCDATSAVFAYDMPWDKLDVTTFSWQKVLGGEGAHGVIILARAQSSGWRATRPHGRCRRCSAWPKGKLAEGVFKGETINTPSMLAVEDVIFALEWAKSVGGLKGLIARSNANAAALGKIVEERSWLGHLAADPATRSTTSVCLTVEGADEGLHQGDGGRS
jgi:phosphoserine aminotransferase